MKKFKTESKRVLDLMINSIYTHKEIFIRELLSNASDAIDKLYYKSLSDGISGLNRDDCAINIAIDSDKRTLKISDNGIGMTADELENNLGIIAKSGSLDFKTNNEQKEDINIIGQFGVGFYSAFMVSDKIEVLSRAYGSEEANLWTSCGVDGYDVTPATKDSYGTDITLYIKPNVDDDNYDEFLEEYGIKDLIKKYSNYIRYPIKMNVTKYDTVDGKEQTHIELETVNDMVPLWKKQKSEISQDEYNKFYSDMFFDSEKPVRVIHTSAEGSVNYKALLFIPSKTPYDYYTKSYEKGLRLYTNGVLITEKCDELLPDFFSFVKGLVDSELTLNISRETIQHNRQLKAIAANIQKKIKNELADLMLNDREAYEGFFKNFGLQFKYGIYSAWGANTELLQDLLLFHSAKEDKMVTLAEYVEKMPESQKFIYYGNGKTVDSIKTLPQTEKILDAGYDILCMTEDVDEFAIKTINKYKEKEFRSIAAEDTGIAEEPEAIEDSKEITDYIKECLGDRVEKVKLSKRLKTHPVCLSSEGDLSIEMEKVLSKMPNGKDTTLKSKKILEINAEHPIYEKIKTLFTADKDKLKDLSEVLLNQALLIQGMPVDNPTKIADIILKLISNN